MSHYPSYQVSDSNGFPEHWQAKRLRFAVKLNPSKNEIPLSDSELVSFVPMDAVGEYGGIRLDEDKELGEIGSGYTYFRDNDVVVAKITPCFENGKGAIAKGLTNECAFGTTELHILRADLELLDPDFLFYLTVSDWFRDLGESEMYGAGGQKRVPEDFIKNLVTGLPPKTEQQAIVGFLDHKTAQIDALIAKKQALLEKLTEQRTALISQAVTKGLDPSVTMKDSGVDWLTEIPAHWQCRRLRFDLKMNPSKSEIQLNDEDLVSFIPMEAVGEYGGLNLDFEKELSEIGSGYTYFSDNDVVVAKITPCFENRKGAFAKDLKNGVAFGTTELHVLRAHNNLLPEYLFNITMSHAFAKLGESEMFGAGGQKRVPETFFKDFTIGIPPIQEQQEILNYIHDVRCKFAKRFDKVTEIISRLNEYRSALITNAVTGKIDVRDFCIPNTTEQREVAHG